MVDRLRPKKDTDKRPPGAPQNDSRQRMTALGWVAVGLLAFVLLQNLAGPRPEEIKISRFFDLVERGDVTDVAVGEGAVEGTYRAGEDERDFIATLPPNFEVNEITRRLEEENIPWTGRAVSIWTNLLISIAPFLLLGALYYFFIVRRLRNQLGGQGPLSLGKNKAKLYDRTDMKTTFKDVAGVDEVEAELTELVDYLKNSQKFQKVGARIPKGVLLVGPPGTGKTLLARAVAGEAGGPVFFISAAGFI